MKPSPQQTLHNCIVDLKVQADGLAACADASGAGLYDRVLGMSATLHRLAVAASQLDDQRKEKP